MLNTALPLGVLAIMLMFVAQSPSLISHAILNQTIRKAQEVDPPNVHLLIAKIEPRPRWPDALAGWIMVVTGLALGGAAIFATAQNRAEALQLDCCFPYPKSLFVGPPSPIFVLV